MQNFGVILSLIGLLFVIMMAVLGGFAWAIRQEGRINLANKEIAANKELHNIQIANLSDKLADAIKALAQFDENTQEQVDSYRKHTEFKIDELSKSISTKFEKVFDKLDKKMDKD